MQRSGLLTSSKLRCTAGYRCRQPLHKASRAATTLNNRQQRAARSRRVCADKKAMQGVSLHAYWETPVTSLLADSQLTTAYTSHYSNYTAAQTVLCVANFMADVLAYVIAILRRLLLQHRSHICCARCDLAAPVEALSYSAISTVASTTCISEPTWRASPNIICVARGALMLCCKSSKSKMQASSSMHTPGRSCKSLRLQQSSGLADELEAAD
eukprot:1072-Heterococcus_DN1.PRE.2